MWNPGRVVANFARSRPEAARPSAHGGATAGAELSDERSGGVRCRPPRSAAAVSARGEPGRAAGEGVPPPGSGAAVGGAAAGMCPGRPAEGTGLNLRGKAPA